MIRIGALWQNVSKKGDTIFSGNLGNDARLLILPNGYKAKDNHPDFYVYIVERADKQKKKDFGPPSSSQETFEEPPF